MRYRYSVLGLSLPGTSNPPRNGPRERSDMGGLDARIRYSTVLRKQN